MCIRDSFFALPIFATAHYCYFGAQVGASAPTKTRCCIGIPAFVLIASLAKRQPNAATNTTGHHLTNLPPPVANHPIIPAQVNRRANANRARTPEMLATPRPFPAPQHPCLGSSCMGIYLRPPAYERVRLCPYDLKCVKASPCLLYTSPSPRDLSTSRMPSSA